MGAADTILFALLALADACLLLHLHRRRQRRYRVERMMRSLRLAVRREIRTVEVEMPATSALVLQQAS